MKIIPCVFQKTDAMTLSVDETLFAYFCVDSPLSVHCFDHFFISNVKWWIHISSMIMNWYKNFAYCSETSPNTETSSRHCFCSIMSKCGTHLTHSFLIYMFTVNMRCIALFEISTMADSSHTFSPRSFNTIFWILFIVSGMVTSFGWPLWCSFWKLIWLRLNCATKYFTDVNDGTDSFRVEFRLVLILVELRPFKSKYCITWSIFSIFTNSLKTSTINGCQTDTKQRSVFKLKLYKFSTFYHSNYC